MMRTFAGFAAGVLLALTVVSAVQGFQAENTPNCPTEDSCALDFHNGRWTVEEVTP